MSDENKKLNRRPPRIRLNEGAWNPLVDMMDVFPGHRGSSRDGELELYDAPLNIRFEIEEATKSEPILQAVEEWEGSQSFGPGYAGRQYRYFDWDADGH